MFFRCARGGRGRAAAPQGTRRGWATTVPGPPLLLGHQRCRVKSVRVRGTTVPPRLCPWPLCLCGQCRRAMAGSPALLGYGRCVCAIAMSVALPPSLLWHGHHCVTALLCHHHHVCTTATITAVPQPPPCHLLWHARATVVSWPPLCPPPCCATAMAAPPPPSLLCHGHHGDTSIEVPRPQLCHGHPHAVATLLPPTPLCHGHLRATAGPCPPLCHCHRHASHHLLSLCQPPPPGSSPSPSSLLLLLIPVARGSGRCRGAGVGWDGPVSHCRGPPVPPHTHARRDGGTLHAPGHAGAQPR